MDCTQNKFRASSCRFRYQLQYTIDVCVLNFDAFLRTGFTPTQSIKSHSQQKAIFPEADNDYRDDISSLIEPGGVS